MNNDLHIHTENIKKYFRHVKFYRSYYWIVGTLFPILLNIVIPIAIFLIFCFFIICCRYDCLVGYCYDPDIPEGFSNYDIFASLLPIIVSLFAIVISSKNDIEIGMKYSELRKIGSRYMYSIGFIIDIIIVCTLFFFSTYFVASDFYKLLVASISLYFFIHILIQEIPFFEGDRALKGWLELHLTALERKNYRTARHSNYEQKDFELRLINYLRQNGKIYYEKLDIFSKENKLITKVQRKELDNFLLIRLQVKSISNDFNDYSQLILKNNQYGNMQSQIQEKENQIYDELDEINDLIDSLPDFIRTNMLSSNICSTCFTNIYLDYLKIKGQNNLIDSKFKNLLFGIFNKLENIQADLGEMKKYENSHTNHNLHYYLSFVMSYYLTSLEKENEYFFDILSDYISSKNQNDYSSPNAFTLFFVYVSVHSASLTLDANKTLFSKNFSDFIKTKLREKQWKGLYKHFLSQIDDSSLNTCFLFLGNLDAGIITMCSSACLNLDETQYRYDSLFHHFIAYHMKTSFKCSSNNSEEIHQYEKSITEKIDAILEHNHNEQVANLVCEVYSFLS